MAPEAWLSTSGGLTTTGMPGFRPWKGPQGLPNPNLPDQTPYLADTCGSGTTASPARPSKDAAESAVPPPFPKFPPAPPVSKGPEPDNNRKDMTHLGLHVKSVHCPWSGPETHAVITKALSEEGDPHTQHRPTRTRRRREERKGPRTSEQRKMPEEHDRNSGAA